MSRYTVMLRWIIETQKAAVQGDIYAKVVASAQDNSIFIRNYPLFDESHREELNTKIINHYLFREIAYETVALWKNRLAEKMDLIMPKYNEMYRALSQQFNIFQNVNTVRKYLIQEKSNDERNRSQNTQNDRTSSATGTNTTQNSGTQDYTSSSEAQNTGNNHTSGNNNTKHSDYPQANISTGDYLSDEDVTTTSNQQNTSDTASGNSAAKTVSSEGGKVDTSTSATDKDTGSLTGSENGSQNKNVDYSENISGLQGYPIDALVKFMENIYNIDKMIIEELNSLFFFLY